MTAYLVQKIISLDAIAAPEPMEFFFSRPYLVVLILIFVLAAVLVALILIFRVQRKKKALEAQEKLEEAQRELWEKKYAQGKETKDK